jgi:hypothetical protein
VKIIQFGLYTVYYFCRYHPKFPTGKAFILISYWPQLSTWDCSIALLPEFYIQLPPLFTTCSLLMLLKPISTSYRCFFQQQLKFYLPQKKKRKKNSEQSTWETNRSLSAKLISDNSLCARTQVLKSAFLISIQSLPKSNTEIKR